MSQRRMPSGQGPARGAPRRSSGPTSARLASRRGRPAVRTAAATGARLRGVLTGGVLARGVRRAAGPARRTKAPARPRRISGRAAALGLLLIALVLAYAYPVRIYLSQQAEIDAMQQSQAEQRQQIQELLAQLKRWDDPEYVAAQARSRLQLVHVGEKIYMVVAEDPAASDADVAESDSWLNQLWSSVQAADNPPQP